MKTISGHCLRQLAFTKKVGRHLDTETHKHLSVLSKFQGLRLTTHRASSETRVVDFHDENE